MKNEELKQKKLKVVYKEMKKQTKVLEEVSEKMLGLQLMSWALSVEGIEPIVDGWGDYLRYYEKSSEKTRDYLDNVLGDVVFVEEEE